MPPASFFLSEKFGFKKREFLLGQAPLGVVPRLQPLAHGLIEKNSHGDRQVQALAHPEHGYTDGMVSHVAGPLRDPLSSFPKITAVGSV